MSAYDHSGVRRRKLRQRLFEQWAGLCAICHEPLDIGFNIDHRVPKARGGRDALENLQPTHVECNQTKSAT